MDPEILEMRQRFIAIAIMEHHQMLEPQLSVYDICERLGKIWKEVQNEAKAKVFALEADCILAINQRIAKSFNAEPGEFRKKDDWQSFVEECGSVEEDPYYSLSWMFSALYWEHLTKFRLATVWLFINAIRLQHGLPECRLSEDKLGPFLHSLSGSGPPTHDGQTFSPDEYS